MCIVSCVLLVFPTFALVACVGVAGFINMRRHDSKSASPAVPDIMHPIW